jgi:hypothetical protein
MPARSSWPTTHPSGGSTAVAGLDGTEHETEAGNYVGHPDAGRYPHENLTHVQAPHPRSHFGTGGGHDARAEAFAEWCFQLYRHDVDVRIEQMLEKSSLIHRAGVNLYNRIQRAHRGCTRCFSPSSNCSATSTGAT